MQVGLPERRPRWLGILLGFWLRERTPGRKGAQESAFGTGANWPAAAELARTQAESAARAGFESLAAERGTVRSPAGSRARRTRARTEAKARRSATGARISELEGGAEQRTAESGGKTGAA